MTYIKNHNYKLNNCTYIYYETLSSNHAHARLQCRDIQFGTSLYSDCKSYSELVDKCRD